MSNLTNIHWPWTRRLSGCSFKHHSCPLSNECHCAGSGYFPRIKMKSQPDLGLLPFDDRVEQEHLCSAVCPLWYLFLRCVAGHQELCKLAYFSITLCFFLLCDGGFGKMLTHTFCFFFSTAEQCNRFTAGRRPANLNFSTWMFSVFSVILGIWRGQRTILEFPPA